MRRSRHEIPKVLAAPWQSIFDEQVFKPRNRRRASYLDTLEPVIRFLHATGQIDAYARPGLDPLDVIQAEVEVRAKP